MKRFASRSLAAFLASTLAACAAPSTPPPQAPQAPQARMAPPHAATTRLVLAEAVPADTQGGQPQPQPSSQPQPQPPPPAPQPQPEPQSQPFSSSPPPAANETSSAAHRAGNGRFYGWISLAIGAEAGVVAIVTSIMMVHYQGVRAGDCNSQNVCSQAGYDANGRMSDLAGWNAGAWALAAIGLGVGAYLVITNPADGSGRQTAIGVAPNSSGMGLNVRSLF